MRLEGYKVQEKEVTYINGTKIKMLHFPGWEDLPNLVHGMSTREGGVSRGIYATMNFKEDGEDPQENIRENYRRIAAYLGCDVNRMVRPSLVHGNHVHIVEEKDYGNGATRKSELQDIDALITNIPGVTLCATFADCVPLFFYDKRKQAIGLAHSGWRGTVKKIGLETVKAMQNAFQSDPNDILAGIGPCICKGCYQVGEDTAREFQNAFKETEFFKIERILQKNIDGTYQLDLRKANKQVLLEAGIPKENITIASICTCCNPNLLFSHRATQGKRGAMGAFLGLKEKPKLQMVMELIEKATSLMAEKDCEDKEVKQELLSLQTKLREITGNKKLQIQDYKRYWSYTDLETIAKTAMFLPPQKSNLTEEAIKEIIFNICKVKYDEATMDYMLKVLEVETGLDNITDYVYYPEEVGLDPDASFEEIVEKILLDRK